MPAHADRGVDVRRDRSAGARLHRAPQEVAHLGNFPAAAAARASCCSPMPARWRARDAAGRGVVVSGSRGAQLAPLGASYLALGEPRGARRACRGDRGRSSPSVARDPASSALPLAALGGGRLLHLGGLAWPRPWNPRRSLHLGEIAGRAQQGRGKRGDVDGVGGSEPRDEVHREGVCGFNTRSLRCGAVMAPKGASSTALRPFG